MFEKKQMLPIGSKVTVRYALDGGAETLLVIVGHLSLRNKTVCHYDYVCVQYPMGFEAGILYINHSDIVRVICRAAETDEAYIKWRDKKYIEYKVYYENYDHTKRADIDAMRGAVVYWQNKLDEIKERKPIQVLSHIAVVFLGAGVTVVLTGSWWTGLCALIFAAWGYFVK